MLQMNSEAFDLVVRQNTKYRQEQRIVFFHEHLPQMQAVYSRFFLLNRRELFREQTCNFKQVVMSEGDKADTNLYMVREGQILLKRHVELEKGVTKQVTFAVLEKG